MIDVLLIFVTLIVTGEAQGQGWGNWQGGEMPSSGWSGQSGGFNGGQGFGNGPPGGFDATPPEFAAAMGNGGMNTQPPPMPPGMSMSNMGQFNPMMGQGNPMEMQGQRMQRGGGAWQNNGPGGWNNGQNPQGNTPPTTTVETTTIPVPTTTKLRSVFVKTHLRKQGGQKPTTAPKFANMAGNMKMPFPMPDGKPQVGMSMNMGMPFNMGMGMGMGISMGKPKQHSMRRQQQENVQSTPLPTGLPTTMETTTSVSKQTNGQRNMQGRAFGMSMWNPNQAQYMKKMQPNRFQQMKKQNYLMPKSPNNHHKMAEMEQTPPQMNKITQSPAMQHTNSKLLHSKQPSYNTNFDKNSNAQTPLVQMFSNGLNKMFNMFARMQSTIGKLVTSMDKLVTMQ